MKTIILTLTLACSILFAQAQTLAPSEIPAAARVHFDKTHGTEMQYAPEWKLVDGTYVAEYEVHFIPNFDVYDANGKFLHTKTKTLVKFFPTCIKNELNKKYAGSKMKRAEILKSPDSKVTYTVEVQGKKLQYNDQCQLLSSSDVQPKAKQMMSAR